ncbi:MAG: protein kinase domain-containing protein, partial [Planctomycetota bacterium]
DRQVALKRLTSVKTFAADRFLREARAALKLNHRNICRVFESGKDARGPFFVMELIEGESLQDRIDREGPLTEEQFVSLAGGLLRALCFAHKRAVVHRDISPRNVMLTPGAVPKLMDFGLARIGLDSDLDETGYGMGTPDYVAPEQLQDAKSADHRADIYSLGATLHAALTGRRPRRPQASMIPPAWRRFIMTCLEERPEDRYFSAEAMLEEMRRATGWTIGAEPPREQSVRCPDCRRLNPMRSAYCDDCGAGLRQRCPSCGEESPVVCEQCPDCGADMRSREEADRMLDDARRYLKQGRYGRAIRTGRAAREIAVDREEVARIITSAKRRLEDRERIRESAIRAANMKQHEQSFTAWQSVLKLSPSDQEALAATRELEPRVRAERIRRWLSDLHKAIDARNWARGRHYLLELRQTGTRKHATKVDRAESRLNALRRRLVADYRRSFERQLRCRLWSSVELTLLDLANLGMPAEHLERLRQRYDRRRSWQRRRRATALGFVILLYAAAAGALLVVPPVWLGPAPSWPFRIASVLPDGS